MAHFGVKVDNHMVGLSKPLEGIKYPSPLSHTNADKQTSEESLETTTTTTPTLHVKTRQSRDIHGDESKTPREVPHSAESKRYVSPLSDYAIAISPNMVDISATNTVGQSKSSPFKRTADEAFNRSAEKKTSNKSVDFFVEERIQMKKDEGGKKRGHRTEKKGSSVMVGNLKRHENINSNAKQVIHQTFAKKTSNKHVDKKDDTLKKENEGSTIDIRNRVEGRSTSSSKDVTPSSKAWLSCSICLKAKQKQYFSRGQIARDASIRECRSCCGKMPITCSICRFQKERSCYSQTGKKKRRCRDCEEIMQEELRNAVITCFICQVKKHRSCYPKRRCRDCIEAICKEVNNAEHCTKKRRCTEAIEAIEAVYEENNLLASQLKEKKVILSGMQKALEDQLNAKHQEYDASRENEKMEVLPIENQTMEPSNKHVDKKDDTLKKENEGSTIDIRNRVEGSITSGSKDVTPSSKAWLSCSICLKAKQKQYFHPKQITRDASTRKCARCDENAPIICSICRFQKERSCYSQTGKKKRRCRDCTEAMQEEFDHVVITCFICQVKKHRSCYPERRCRDCIEAIYKKVKHAEHCTKKRRCTEAIEAIEAVYEENNLLASQLKQKIGILSGMQKALEDQLNAKHQEYDASRENEKMEVLPSNNQKQTEYNLNVEEKECKPLPVQNQGGNRNENLLTFNSLLEENQQLKQQLVQQQQQEVERNTKLIEENEKFKQQQQQQVERNKKLIEEIEKLKQQLMHQEGERETYAKVIEEKQMLKQQLMQQQQDHKIITSLKNELKAELECPVCLDTYDNPYMVADCGHRFCKCCIEDAIAKSGKECPLCRARVTSKRGLRKDELIGRIGEVLFKNEEVEGNQSHDDRGPPSRQQKQGENDRQQNNDRSGNRRGGNRGRRRR
ncbi:hypothetical protein CTEN210_06144 [Chaetoceros tenuissimus]|uniref:RING-type E3 ubiquitin transferase n=1 Tax=Chaetoceros tenuissimus TaxID=426638 RepID=A0AAD3H4F7_9STRA|nr:hypothetical protein CTEN210_06144 [Chaetoceros tenuissimus]